MHCVVVLRELRDVAGVPGELGLEFVYHGEIFIEENLDEEDLEKLLSLIFSKKCLQWMGVLIRAR